MNTIKHNRFISLILTISVLGFISETKSFAQSDMLWRVGGQYGVMGNTFCRKGAGENFTMSLTLGFDIALKNTPWRWGSEAGIMNQGITDYFFSDDEPDMFVRPNFAYIGTFTDYGFRMWKQPMFCRAGLAYARQSDMWIHHVEHKSIPLVITGVGFDWNYFKVMLNGYIAPEGNYIITVSGGFYFGRNQHW